MNIPYNKIGHVIVHTFRNPDGALERKEYELEGGPYFYFEYRFFNDNQMKFKEFLSLGPYKFRFVEHDFSRGGPLFINMNHPFQGFLIFWYKASKIFDIFYRRSIYTLYIWGLADHEPHTYPTFGDIHLVKKIKKVFKHDKINPN